jgi:hypothetical protein
VREHDRHAVALDLDLDLDLVVQLTARDLQDRHATRPYFGGTGGTRYS